MAVTQQLARVSGAYLTRCRTSAAASPNTDPEWDPPANDWIELDWSPRFLSDACELAGVDSCTLEALNRALNGDPDVDVSVLSHPEATGGFGPPPTALAPDSVAHVAAKLAGLDWGGSVLPATPADRPEVLAGHHSIGDPVAYLTTHFMALRSFYAEAAQRGLFVVLWWD
ncbi:DUF1877 domain-containing protein [Streptomyces sp. NPDC056672]|uniref:DUF1877 domain-containing protein n=1 Tax=Streptomyces sp. NPDC056672 TaxID=3345906 RepID=UPI00369F026B